MKWWRGTLLGRQRVAFYIKWEEKPSLRIDSGGGVGGSHRNSHRRMLAKTSTVQKNIWAAALLSEERGGSQHSDCKRRGRERSHTACVCRYCHWANQVASVCCRQKRMSWLSFHRIIWWEDFIGSCKSWRWSQDKNLRQKTNAAGTRTGGGKWLTLDIF